MAGNNRDDGFRPCNLSLDEETIDRLAEVGRFRRGHGGDLRPKSGSRSQVVRDAVRLLYRYEVLQQSLIHPKDI